jgi:hypothetical protein
MSELEYFVLGQRLHPCAVCERNSAVLRSVKAVEARRTEEVYERAWAVSASEADVAEEAALRERVDDQAHLASRE